MNAIALIILVGVLILLAVFLIFIVKKNIHYWITGYLKSLLKQFRLRNKQIENIYVCIADHYEPYNGGADKATADARVDAWLKHYPDVAQRFTDSTGNHPCFTFFYPEEEYDAEILDKIVTMCGKKVADVEVHLHHDNDTAEALAIKLNSFKKILHERHGLLRLNEEGDDIIYAFIHGNWALDNSRPDGRKCGVSNELQVLVDTGCYMDMTLPSAPDPSQTATINSIYFARGIDGKNKSHNAGREVVTGESWVMPDELLMVQGPLAFNFYDRKVGLLPKIESSELSIDARVTAERLKIWIGCRVSVRSKEGSVFIKLHTHGAEDRNIDAFFHNGELDRLFSLFDQYCIENPQTKLHYVSAYGMYEEIERLAR